MNQAIPFLATFVLLVAAHAYGQSGAPESGAAAPRGTDATQTSHGAAGITPNALAEQGLAGVPAGEDAGRFQRLEAAISALSAKLDKKDYTAAWLGLGGSLFGGIIGALVAVLTQQLKATQDRELAANRAKLEIGNSFVQWQLKQLSELYGPLHALLQQSQSLYRHMNSVLEAKDSTRFRMRDNVDTDRIDKRVFEIKLSEQWVRFRTVLHIKEVYGRGFGVEDYFNAITDIGARMVKVIEEKAGYARPEQTKLVPLFGKYLAHQAVLERLVNYHKGRSVLNHRPGYASDAPVPPEQPMNVDESAVFPAEIQKVVEMGYRAIIEELNDWRAKATA